MERIYSQLSVVLTVKETDDIIKDLAFISCPVSDATVKLLENLVVLQRKQEVELENERVKELERRKSTCP